MCSHFSSGTMKEHYCECTVWMLVCDPCAVLLRHRNAGQWILLHTRFAIILRCVAHTSICFTRESEREREEEEVLCATSVPIGAALSN